MPRVSVEWEKLDQLIIDGLEDLAIGHWEEAENDHTPLDLDFAHARQLEQVGAFKIAGVRRGSRLVGYAYFRVGSSLQHRSTKQAWCEGLYVDDRARGAGAMALRTIPRLMADIDVKRCFMSAKPHVLLRIGENRATLSDLLTALGWSPFEAVFSKRFGA